MAEPMDGEALSHAQRISVVGMLDLTTTRLVEILATPTEHWLSEDVWYAVTASRSMIEDTPDHTLAAHLGLSASQLADLLYQAGMEGQGRGASSWMKILNAKRASGDPIQMTFTTTCDKHRHKCKWIAFGTTELSTDPLAQVAADSTLPQPPRASETLAHLASRKRLRSLRGTAESDELLSLPAASSKAPAASSDQSDAPPTRRLLSLQQVFDSLGAPKPCCDSNGKPIRAELLTRVFPSSIAGLSPNSGYRRELLQAASAAVFALLSAISVDPLALAAALAVPRQRNAQDDPLRLSLVSSAQPKGRRLQELIAASPLAQNLLSSYLAAKKRGEKMAVLAPILAPLTAQYSLRVFNECFEVRLLEAGGPLKRYSWHYARWHRFIWGSAQAAVRTVTERQRLFGADGLPHVLLTEALAFLVSGQYLQHVAFGTRRVKKSDGSYVEFSKTERTQCCEHLWKLYVQSRSDMEPEQTDEEEQRRPVRRNRIGRSLFLELAHMVAGADQKSYGALDTFAELHGREQAEKLRAMCDEIAEMMHSLLLTTQAEQDAAAAVSKHAGALKLKVTQVETHIKRGMPTHLPSCLDPAPADDEETCAEHCPICAFGSSASDGSRPCACTRQHTKRCVQCAQVHSLQSDFDVLCKAAAGVVERAEVSERAAAPPPPAAPPPQQPAPVSPPPVARSAAGDLKELQRAINRSLLRFRAFHAHERRAAHEAGVMEMLMQELDETGCIVVADWKMKFLSSSFREAMSKFFGKAGMPWHGVMFVRRAHGTEQVMEGEFVVTYVDASMADKKEDGFSTLCAVYLAMKTYKEQHPWIEHAVVKTDGAGAYAGMVFTVGLSMLGELTGIRVTDHFIGESGKGKSQLDGHFGKKASQLRRLVAAALVDIITPDMLFEGIKQSLGKNEVAQSFQPDRSAGSMLDVESIKQLSVMSHRSYEYEADGSLLLLRLRQQTRLGEGLCIEAGKLRKQGAAPFAPPRLLAQAVGGSTEPTFDSTGRRMSDMSAAAAAAARKGPNDETCAPCAPDHDAVPIANVKKRREDKERQVAQDRERREQGKQAAAAALRAASVARCEESEGWHCSIQPDGCPTCVCAFARECDLRKHIQGGKHKEGAMRPFASGVAVGRGNAHNNRVRLVQQALEAVIASSAATAASEPATLQPADGFTLVFCDGQEYELPAPEGGWARAQRLPAVRSTLAQIEFVYNAFTVGETFSPAMARRKYF